MKIYPIHLFLIVTLFLSFQQSIAQNTVSNGNNIVAQLIPVDSLKIVLEEMYDKDQGIRKQLVKAMKEDPATMGEIINEMNRTDSLNQVTVDEILQKYGWTKRSIIGKKASNALFYVVLHAPLMMMEKYFPLLQNQAASGEADRTDVAMMEDRILMYNNKRQVYGTQASNLVRGDAITVIWPVEDPSHLNERRKSVGFTTTIEEYAESMDVPYDPNEKLPAVNPW